MKHILQSSCLQYIGSVFLCSSHRLKPGANLLLFTVLLLLPDRRGPLLSQKIKKIVKYLGGRMQSNIRGARGMTHIWETPIPCCSFQQLPLLDWEPSKGYMSWHSALKWPSTHLTSCGAWGIAEKLWHSQVCCAGSVGPWKDTVKNNYCKTCFHCCSKGGDWPPLSDPLVSYYARCFYPMWRHCPLRLCRKQHISGQNRSWQTFYTLWFSTVPAEEYSTMQYAGFFFITT